VAATKVGLNSIPATRPPVFIPRIVARPAVSPDRSAHLAPSGHANYAAGTTTSMTSATPVKIALYERDAPTRYAVHAVTDGLTIGHGRCCH